jgi:hypothetical protein
MLPARFRRRHLLFRRGDSGLSGGNLGFRYAVAGLRFIDFLLRHQVRPGLHDSGQTAVGKMRHGVSGFRAFQLPLGLKQLRLAAILVGLGPRQLVGELGDFQRGHDLALSDAVADIDGNLLQIPRYFRVDFHFLVGAELGGKCQIIGQSVGPRLGYGDYGYTGCLCLRLHFRVARAGEGEQRQEKEISQVPQNRTHPEDSDIPSGRYFPSPEGSLTNALVQTIFVAGLSPILFI